MKDEHKGPGHTKRHSKATGKPRKPLRGLWGARKGTHRPLCGKGKVLRDLRDGTERHPEASWAIRLHGKALGGTRSAQKGTQEAPWSSTKAHGVPWALHKGTWKPLECRERHPETIWSNTKTFRSPRLKQGIQNSLGNRERDWEDTGLNFLFNPGASDCLFVWLWGI